MNEQIEKIKSLVNNIDVLYVEDNEGLRKNMLGLLNKIFNNVIVAEDGEDGYNKYIKFKPKIIITDINMPKLDGFGMIKKIKALDLECKILILSAFDEKEHLHSAINLGIFRFLHKPVKISELVQAIYDLVLSIQKEENRRLFSDQIKSIFDYQNNIVIMMRQGKFILSNHYFLEFFGVDDLEDFEKKNTDLDKLLLEHKGFLYSTPSAHWYDVATQNEEKLFHVKIKNHKDENRHLILKSRKIPEKEGYFILSFDDITELNLMDIFDAKASKVDDSMQDKKSIFTLMRVAKNSGAEIKIHNFYKGLTIVNNADITKITDDKITMKTTYPQLKIINIAQFMTIDSEIFPKNITCKTIKEIDLDNQSVIIDEISFATHNVVDRKYIRLEPEAKHSCTFYYKDIKFIGSTRIVDISEVSIKLEINALPAGIEIGKDIKISVNLSLNNKTIVFTTSASVYRVDTNQQNYYIVALFELNTQKRGEIRKYLANRQMALIREFKKMDII